MKTSTPALAHPHTGTNYREPLFVSRSGRAFYPIGGASEDGGGDGGTGGAGGSGGEGGATYTAPSTQAELDAIVTRRLDRERTKFADYDDLKAKADELATLKAATATDADKAAQAAKDEARKETKGEFVPRLVKAEFKAAAKGVLTADQLTALLEDLDLSKYVDDKGDIDEDKVEKKVTAFAPSGGGQQQHRDLGQGRRSGSKPVAGEQGREQAQKRFPKKS